MVYLQGKVSKRNFPADRITGQVTAFSKISVVMFRAKNKGVGTDSLQPWQRTTLFVTRLLSAETFVVHSQSHVR